MLKDMIALARRAGDMAMAVHQRGVPMAVEEKGPLDLVTQTDRDIEEFLRNELSHLYPGHGFLGEEGAALFQRGVGPTWVVDPIDGTANFVRPGADWAIAIGLYEDGAAVAGVIHAPLPGLTLAGARGAGATLNGQVLPRLSRKRPSSGLVAFEVASTTPIALQAEVVNHIRDGGMMCRSYGSSTISFMSVARGITDAHVGFDSRSWDVMAGIAILSALGAEIRTNRPLSELQERFSIYAGCASEAERWVELVNRPIPCTP